MDISKAMTYADALDLVIGEIDTALHSVDEQSVGQFVDLLLGAERVFCTGVGRVLLSMQAFVKRLNHLGINSWCVGDLCEPALVSGDILVVGSGSGESVVPVSIASVAKRLGAKVVHIGSNPESTMTPLTDLFVRIPATTRMKREDEIQSGQIMTSLFEQSLYLLGDVVSLMIAGRRGLADIEVLWKRHANLE